MGSGSSGFLAPADAGILGRTGRSCADRAFRGEVGSTQTTDGWFSGTGVPRGPVRFWIEPRFQHPDKEAANRLANDPVQVPPAPAPCAEGKHGVCSSECKADTGRLDCSAMPPTHRRRQKGPCTLPDHEPTPDLEACL